MKCFILPSLLPFAVAHLLRYRSSEIVQAEEDSVRFVKYYADWCPHCQTIAPKWKHATQLWKQKGDSGNGVKFEDNQCFREDGSEGEDADECKSAKVEFFPDVRLEFTRGSGCEGFNMGGDCPCPYTRPNGETVTRCVFYNEAPDTGIDLVAWIQRIVVSKDKPLLTSGTDARVKVHEQVPMQKFESRVCFLKDAPKKKKYDEEKNTRPTKKGDEKN